ncbi:hypothetical protein ACHAWO_009379 [Cyclotella atomus]|uniref:Uncharacterized protein n=1 Tax=Cyclotella atomus TaxID=382360 RepID=A0ABD3N3B0_9STRA
MKVHYLEIVSPYVSSAVAINSQLHNITFSPAPELGNAQIATLTDGSTFGIRAPMHDAEMAVIRPYMLVDDSGMAAKRTNKRRSAHFSSLQWSDPDGKVDDLFCVEHKSKVLHLMDYCTTRHELVRYHNTRCVSSSTSRLEKKSISGAATILPSELLIDEHGVLVDILRAHKNTDSMTMDRISHFLLFGEKLPDGDKPRTKRSSVPSSFSRSTRNIVGRTESSRRRITMPASFSFGKSLRRF